MPSNINTPVPGTGTGVSITTTNETVVATLPPVFTDTTEPVVVLEGLVDFTVGTAGTSLTLRIRRGTGVTGTVVQTVGPLTVVAANRGQFSIVAIDAPGVVSGQQYALTAAVGAATGNSTANLAVLQAQVQSTA